MEYNMKKTVFTGAATAIITPLTKDGIDYENYAKLINWQIEEGIDAIVAVGTTGEGSTLTDKEHKDAIEFCVKEVGGRVPVIAGTGSNDTAYAIEMTQHAAAVGADAMLLVTPYYNKATQKGLIASFSAIADASTKPCILYNVPSRTGCNLLPKTALELSKHENIVGIKEASDSTDRLTELASLKDDIDLYCGNDSQVYTALSLGGRGVISVASNVIPEKMLKITKSYFSGRRTASLYTQIKLLPFIKALFKETNPAPIKYAMSCTGMCREELRLPLTAPSLQVKELIEAELKNLSKSDTL
jgi:4-hydroxy-tetrahydrodipicolinate synthase